MSRRFEAFKAHLYRYPIIGGLAYCTWADHWKAVKEFIVLVSFGTAAFWISAAIGYYTSTVGSPNYWLSLWSTFSNGELFIFSVSILGPTFYLAVGDPDWARRDFPEKVLYASGVALVAILCVAMFSALRGGGAARFRVDELITFSLWLAMAALVLRYLAMVVHTSRLYPIEARRHMTDEFTKAVENHRGEGQ